MGASNGATGANILNNGNWHNGMLSWSAAILPYIEGAALYNNLNFNYRPFTSERADCWFNHYGPDPGNPTDLDTANPGNVINQLVSVSAPSTFFCPSTPPIGPTGNVKNYAMNGGIGAFPAASATFVYAAQGIGGTNLSSCCPERANTGGGIGNKNFWCKMASVADGTSNTFLILEQSSTIKRFNYPTNQFLWTNHQSQGLAVALQGTRNYPPNPDPNNILMTQSTGWGLAGRCSWGFHVGGVMTSMCDGSVQFIADNIALPTWRRMHGRDDGQVFDMPQ